MRTLIITGLALCASSVWAQTETIGDAIVPLLPGLTVRVVREVPRVVNGVDQCAVPGIAPANPLPWECVGSPPFPPAWSTYGAFTIGSDAAGNAYHVPYSTVLRDFGDGTTGYFLRRVTPDGAMEDVARVIIRSGVMEFDPTGAVIDVTNGRISFLVDAWYFDATGTKNPATVGTVEISGLPKLFDTLLTFIPGQQAMSIQTPAHPDGFRSADSLQVWTGNVRAMPDWSQAQPLACMAAQNPTPGQIVSVQDTLPDPTVGQGRYYLVASQSGADRRLGRQFINGTFSARQPAGLPACH